MTERPPNTVQELLEQSVQRASALGRGGENTVYPFAIAADAPADMHALSNYLIRVRHSSSSFKDAMEGSSDLTPPSYLYAHHVAQPLLTAHKTVKDATGGSVIMDIVKRQEGHPVTRENVEEIIRNKDIKALYPLVRDQLALSCAGVGSDFNSTNIFYHKKADGQAELRLIDQYDDAAPQAPGELSISDHHLAITKLFSSFNLNSILKPHFPTKKLDSMLDEAIETIRHETHQNKDMFTRVEQVSAVKLSDSPQALLKTLNKLSSPSETHNR